jgi:molybdopterin molybdotransferase
MSAMISFDEAFSIVMNNFKETGTEIISFSDSLYRILAEDVKSDVDMPPYNRSAVDGYAFNRNDLVSELEVVEVIQAGKPPQKNTGKNQCSKIMTGAMVPDRCDIVFMVEFSKTLSSGKVIFTGSEIKPNMSVKGEDVRAGDIVLRKGKFIKPQDIAVFASVGYTDVKVSRKPLVGVLSTGDELVEPEKTPDISHIRNSNAFQLMAQVERAGAKGRYYGIAPDVKETTSEMIQKALNDNDLVVLTGGVSMGDFDFVPDVLIKAGVKILFDQVNVQPGKPTVFGVHPKAVVFGLPGNPVSSYVQFETLVRPLICRMMGFDWNPMIPMLPMAVKYERRSGLRAGWIPVIITMEREVKPVDYHGSAHIAALPYTDGIIAIPAGKTIIEKGELVGVRQI